MLKFSAPIIEEWTELNGPEIPTWRLRRFADFNETLWRDNWLSGKKKKPSDSSAFWLELCPFPSIRYPIGIDFIKA